MGRSLCVSVRVFRDGFSFKRGRIERKLAKVRLYVNLEEEKSQEGEEEEEERGERRRGEGGGGEI